MLRLPTIAIVTLVLLRLLTGWHFFNEGVKKLDSEFTSAGFLRTAKGPFAPMFRSMVKGPYGAHVDLARPVEFGTRPLEERAAIDSWSADYGARAEAAIRGDKPLPIDIDPAVPGSQWVGNIKASWDEGIERLKSQRIGEEDLEKIKQIRDARLGDIVYYLHEIRPVIEDLQHEQWRLHKLREKVGNHPAPYQVLLIESGENEIWQNMQPWIASVRDIENRFVSEVAEIVAKDRVGPLEVESALAERSALNRIDFVVTCVVLGSGICLFLGLATPVAAIVAAGFLFSLILTQPPWVPGVEMMSFFTWSIELMALLVLAATGAGAWAGLDGVFYRAFVRHRHASNHEVDSTKPATAA